MKYLLAIILLTTNLNVNSQRLALVVSKKFDRYIISAIKKRVYDIYGVKIDSVGEFTAPVDNDNVFADINILKGVSQDNYEGVIGLTDIVISYYYDGIFPEEVYGYTDSNICVISEHMLSGRHRRRIANVVAHEVGHIYGLLDHGAEKKCIMISNGHLEDKYLCARCKRLLKKKSK